MIEMVSAKKLSDIYDNFDVRCSYRQFLDVALIVEGQHYKMAQELRNENYKLKMSLESIQREHELDLEEKLISQERRLRGLE